MSDEHDDVRWYHLAVCQEMELNWFFDDYEADPVFAKTMDGICLACPVRSRCLREGIEDGKYGLWGGVFLNNGKMDAAKNAHKTEDIWEVIRSGIVG